MEKQNKRTAPSVILPLAPDQTGTVLLTRTEQVQSLSAVPGNGL